MRRYNSIAIIAALFSAGYINEDVINSKDFGSNRRKKLEEYINRGRFLIDKASEKRNRRRARNLEMKSRGCFYANT